MDTPNDAKKKLPKTEEQLYDELSKAIVFEKDEDGNLTVNIPVEPDIKTIILKISAAEIITFACLIFNQFLEKMRIPKSIQNVIENAFKPKEEKE